MILAVLLFISGIAISVVAEYYSIMGLMAIFSAAPIPIAVMGIALGVGKLVQATWLKTYWPRLPATMKLYGVLSVCILMLITTLGCFGFLSKAHSDQTLVSGDSQAKVAIYDEKIKTAKDNIDANRRAIKQMDDAVDQVMGRSNDEKGADKAVAIRRSQTKERVRLLGEIENEQRNVARLSEERAPYAAEFRKMESEVGPIKYIAAFIYGDNPDANILERAVTWVIVLIVIVFDPLAVVMLLASQMTWAWYKNPQPDRYDHIVAEGSGITVDELVEQAEEHTPDEVNKHTQAVVENNTEGELPAYLTEPFEHFKNLKPMPAPSVEPEPKLQTTPFDPIPGADARTLIVGDQHMLDNLRSALDEANGNVFELANYVQGLQGDYAIVSELHQKSMNRESDLNARVAELEQELQLARDTQNIQVNDLIPTEAQERLESGEHISITELPDLQAFIKQGIENGTLQVQGATEPATSPLEGAASLHLLKDMGIVTADNKLSPEYGGEEDQEDSDSGHHSSPQQPEILKMGVDVIDRPGDYITDPLENLLIKREPKNGFGSEFPNGPERGDLFLRTDFRPSRLFKWNDTKWIEVNKNVTGAYAYNDAYIQYLAEQVMSGKYSWDDLTDTEIDQVQTLIGGRRG